MQKYFVNQKWLTGLLDKKNLNCNNKDSVSSPKNKPLFQLFPYQQD